jgi:iron complex transport system ATP-binding protein
MLQVEGLSVALGGREVVSSVSFSLEKGTWLGIVGPNGAGKSTLLRSIAGLVEHEGEVRIGDRRALEATRREAARLVAFVPQRPVFPPAMPITDYVLLGRSAHHSLLGAETTRDRQVVAAVLERLQLGGLADRPLGQVSGGEAQRAVLARALAQEAPVLLLDEPTTSLDLGHGQQVMELVDSLRKEHALTVVSAIHDLTTAAQYAEELMLLVAGSVVAAGPPDQVLTQASIAKYFGADVDLFSSPSGLVVAPRRNGASASPSDCQTKEVS